MNNQIISFLLGSSIKIVDDYYDSNLYTQNFILFIKIIGLLLFSYWNLIDFEHNFIFVMEIIICFFAKQIDNQFYKKVTLLTICFFIGYLFFKKGNYFSKTLNISSITVYFMIALTVVYLESILFTSDCSKTKLCCRGTIVIISILYYLFLKKYNKPALYKDFIMLWIGYFSVSVYNLSRYYKLI